MSPSDIGRLGALPRIAIGLNTLVTAGDGPRETGCRVMFLIFLRPLNRAGDFCRDTAQAKNDPRVLIPGRVCVCCVFVVSLSLSIDYNLSCYL